MRRLAFLSVLLVTTAAAPPVAVDAPAATLAAAERAFAATAVREGFNPALLRFVADEATIFRPGPVAARPWLRSAEPAPATVDWWPAYVEASCDGTLGWSTGPVTIDGGPVRSHYVTVWRRDADGLWRFVFDQGSAHAPESDPHPRDAQPATPDRSSCSSTGRDRDPRPGLYAADDALSAELRTSAADAYRRWFAERPRLHRWGAFPILERNAAIAAASAQPAITPVRRLGGSAAASGDLGFTHGEVTWTDPDRGKQDGFYFRIWRRSNGRWQLIFDQIRPLDPARRSN